MRPLALAARGRAARRGRARPRGAVGHAERRRHRRRHRPEVRELHRRRSTSKGNVHIEAKGYAVKTAARRPPAPPRRRGPGAPAGAARPPAPGAAHPPLLPRDRARRAGDRSTTSAIFINAQWIREVKASEPQVVMEITRTCARARTG